MPKLNEIYIYKISDDLPYLIDYVPYLLRTKWFEYRIWIDNIEEKCDLTKELSIKKRLSQSSSLNDQERMQELIEWLEDYPQYRDVLIW